MRWSEQWCQPEAETVLEDVGYNVACQFPRRRSQTLSDTCNNTVTNAPFMRIYANLCTLIRKRSALRTRITSTNSPLCLFHQVSELPCKIFIRFFFLLWSYCCFRTDLMRLRELITNSFMNTKMWTENTAPPVELTLRKIIHNWINQSCRSK